MAKAEFVEEMRKLFEGAKNIPLDKLTFTYNDVMYPAATCDVDTFNAIKSFEARDDDLMLVAYPKCGSNWTMSLLHDMVHKVHNKDPSPVNPPIEFKTLNKFEKIQAEPSPRVLTTHLHKDNIPQPFFEKKVKMLVLFRNPKDTAVSLFHFYNKNPLLPTYDSWDNFFPDFMAGKVIWGSYFDHAIAWNHHSDETTFFITYEEMKADLEASVKKISDFLGLPLTDEQVKQIADKGTFKSMKENSKQTHGHFGDIVFRKGDVGDWKNHFSQAQSQEMDAKFEERLAGTKIGNLLNYNMHCKW